MTRDEMIEKLNRLAFTVRDLDDRARFAICESEREGWKTTRDYVAKAMHETYEQICRSGKTV